jgi:hypothetical protein
MGTGTYVDSCVVLLVGEVAVNTATSYRSPGSNRRMLVLQLCIAAISLPRRVHRCECVLRPPQK